MIIIILLLILATLLFGANAVKSAAAKTLTYVCGGFLAFFVAVWVGSLFGADGTKVGFWVAVAGIFAFVMSKAPKPR